ncbi:hypothetical protein Afil01_13120 [Actinorhabdospora filicis]|uniref:Uncharacterized protein n=1 Tax=Actinorhabdospora filicis TaxID=1785913 RepID=A0A9W6W9C0_9ACTN|nr:hypothetical protein [Actinorhabdospora filicis]GLZ76505.1 hypothetical protein Afil01_13120 [Actinorhabdospora filicis]
MTGFSYEEHVTKGDAETAKGWVEASGLPQDQKEDLLTFIGRFPSLCFVKEDAAALDHHEEEAGVPLPPWLRELRSVLAAVDPPVQVRVDDFDWYDSPRCEDVEDIWYELRPGYANDEERELFAEDAQVYRIGSWWGEDRSYLLADLEKPDDVRVFDTAAPDLRDNKYDGRPVRGSVYPIFRSYARFLARVEAVRFEDDTELEAQD